MSRWWGIINVRKASGVFLVEMIEKKDKLERVLSIYTKLMNGSVVNKAEEANRFGVNEKSIQRDVEDIRCYLETSAEDAGIDTTVIYDRLLKGYR